MKNADETRTRGRPRAFQPDQVLEGAMLAFWEGGFEGTSMARLSQVMGMNPSSIYATFGDKDGLFRAAIGAYVAGPGQFSMRAFATPGPARDVVERLLHGAADAMTVEGRPRGCMVAMAAANCPATASPVAEEIAAMRRSGARALAERISADVAEGRLPADTDAQLLASTSLSVLYGMSILARDGATTDELHRIADAALQSWPKAT